MKYCKTCYYYEAVQGGQGICHRFPPTACVVMVPQQHPISRQVQMVPQSMATAPTCSDEAWCGEWKELPPKLALA